MQSKSSCRRASQTGPCVPTGRESESTRSTLDRAGDLRVVAPLEAAPHHAGRRPVAEGLRAPEAQHRAVAFEARLIGVQSTEAGATKAVEVSESSA